MAADIDQLTWRKKSARGRTTSDELIEHARREQDGEQADDETQLLDVRGDSAFDDVSAPGEHVAHARPQIPL